MHLNKVFCLVKFFTADTVLSYFFFFRHFAYAHRPGAKESLRPIVTKLLYLACPNLHSTSTGTFVKSV